MSQSPDASVRFRATVRSLLLGMILVAITGSIFSGIIIRETGRESGSRDVLESFHLKSLVIASEALGKITALERQQPNARPVPDRRGVSTLGITRETALLGIGEHLEDLGRIQDEFGDPAYEDPVERARARYARLVVDIALADQGDPEARAALPVRTGSLVLAIEQLRRLHVHASNASIASLASDAADRTQLLIVVGSVGALVLIGFAWRIFVFLRSAFRHEQAILVDLERSRLQALHLQKIEALGRLAGGVAHDFNNLLTVILTNSELIARRCEDSMQEIVLEIDQAARRGADLTRQLLTFGRPDIGDPQLIEVNEVVRETSSILKLVLGEDVVLETQLEPEVGLVRAGAGCLEQILVNLAVNARDAMPGGGTLTIETAGAGMESKFEVEGAAKPGAVRISVYDTGVGINALVREFIFEPFFSTKEPDKGTGLGLSTVHGIVTACSGTITVDSEPELGTRFDILLPLAEDVESTPAASESAGTLQGSETILLVEDQVEVRRVCAGFLREAGYQVYEATDGEDALRIFGDVGAPIDMIVTDVIMPRMNGPELVKHGRKLQPDVRFLFITGYTDDTELKKEFWDPSLSMLRKPFGRAELLRRVRLVLTNEPDPT